MQNLASIQPRTSLSKLAKNQSTVRNSLKKHRPNVRALMEQARNDSKAPSSKAQETGAPPADKGLAAEVEETGKDSTYIYIAPKGGDVLASAESNMHKSVTLAERGTSLSTHAEARNLSNELFKLVDKDNSGKINQSEFAKFKQNPRRSALSEICSRYQAQVLDFALKRLEVTGVLLLFVYSAKCYFPDISFLS